jgi:hypothetical protein
MEAVAPPDNGGASLLPPKLRYVLWRRVDKRLHRGEVLIATEHFQQVMERDFRKLVHVPASERVKDALREMIVRVNEEHPETYLTQGIRNAVIRYLHDMEARMEGQPAEVLAESRSRIKELIRDDRTAFFLESIGVEVPSKGVTASVEKSILMIVSGEKLAATAEAQEQAQGRRRPGLNLAPVRLSAPELADDAGAALVELPTDKERKARVAEMRKEEERLAAEEIMRAPRNLRSLLKQGLLEEKETETLGDLYGIEERLAAGEIDAEAAQRLREQIDASVREKLQQRLRAAVSFAVHYINAAEALKRLPVAGDGALRFLIRHESVVTSTDRKTDMSAMLAELEEDEETLDRVTRIMERREHEARMISANMPPFRYVLGEGRITNVTVEEGFVDELRGLDHDALSDRLNSEDAEIRVRFAADLRCLVTLIRDAVDPSPFNLAVRRLKIHRTITNLYLGADDPKVGRHKVTYFASQRVARMYPDLTAGERAEIQEESRKIMAAVDAERSGEDESNKLRFYRG